MKKRAIIFAPEAKDREVLAGILDEFFKRSFEDYYPQIEIQKYSMLREPLADNQIGHWGTAETFVIFDRRLCSSRSRLKSLRDTPYYKALKASYEMSLGLCDKNGIPYVIYKGEIAKKEEKVFVAQIGRLTDKIRSRLESKV